MAAGGLGLTLDGAGREAEAVCCLGDVEIEPIETEQHGALACGQGVHDGEHLGPYADVGRVVGPSRCGFSSLPTAVAAVAVADLVQHRLVEVGASVLDGGPPR